MMEYHLQESQFLSHHSTIPLEDHSSLSEIYAQKQEKIPEINVPAKLTLTFGRPNEGQGSLSFEINAQKENHLKYLSAADILLLDECLTMAVGCYCSRVWLLYVYSTSIYITSDDGQYEKK